MYNIKFAVCRSLQYRDNNDNDVIMAMITNYVICDT